MSKEAMKMWNNIVFFLSCRRKTLAMLGDQYERVITERMNVLRKCARKDRSTHIGAARTIANHYLLGGLESMLLIAAVIELAQSGEGI